MSAVCLKPVTSPLTPRTDCQLFDFDELDVDACAAMAGSSEEPSAREVPVASVGSRTKNLGHQNLGLCSSVAASFAVGLAAREQESGKRHSMKDMEDGEEMEKQAERPCATYSQCLSLLERRFEERDKDAAAGSYGSASERSDSEAEPEVAVIAGLSGTLSCTISGIEPSWRVRDLKARIEQFDGVAIKLQRLLVDNRLLRDSELVEELFPPGSTKIQVTLLQADARRAELLESVSSGRVVLAELDEDAWLLDQELVLAAMQASQGRGLEQAGPWRSNKQVVLAAVRCNGLALRHADESLREDHETVLAAVQDCGSALEHAIGETRSCDEIVLTAVGQTCLAASFASDAFRRNPSLALAAVRANADVLPYIPEVCLNERRFLLAALAANGLALQHLGEALRNEIETVLTAVRSSGPAVRFAAEQLRENVDFALQAVDANPLAFEHLTAAMRSQPDVVANAVLASPAMIRFAAPQLRSNARFLDFIERLRQQKCQGYLEHSGGKRPAV